MTGSLAGDRCEIREESPRQAAASEGQPPKLSETNCAPWRDASRRRGEGLPSAVACDQVSGCSGRWHPIVGRVFARQDPIRDRMGDGGVLAASQSRQLRSRHAS